MLQTAPTASGEIFTFRVSSIIRLTETFGNSSLSKISLFFNYRKLYLLPWQSSLNEISLAMHTTNASSIMRQIYNFAG
jgi:polyferredoxin